MDPYYILKINRFSEDDENYTTAQQIGIGNFFDDAPSVSFEKSRELDIEKMHYKKYKLTTEKMISQRGRAYATLDVFESFIAITDSSFYYDYNENILILHCSKDIFNQFVAAFKNNNDFKFEKLHIDFEDIIDNQKSTGVMGIWLGKIDDVNVSTLLLLGNNVENSDKYRQLRLSGAEINNLTIIYRFYDTQKKLMITKDGGIILYKNEDESDALMLIKDVYKNLIS